MTREPIHSPSVSLRPADEGDRRALWEWRNDPATIEASFDTTPVPWDVHDRWFDAALADPDRDVLIVEVAGERAGMVRFDRDGDDGFVVSINVAPAARGRGIGAAALRSAVDHLTSTQGSTRVTAKVRPANVASLRAFQAAGFVEIGRSGDEVQLLREGLG